MTWNQNYNQERRVCILKNDRMGQKVRWKKLATKYICMYADFLCKRGPWDIYIYVKACMVKKNLERISCRNLARFFHKFNWTAFLLKFSPIFVRNLVRVFFSHLFSSIFCRNLAHFFYRKTLCRKLCPKLCTYSFAY